ncbi:uncharacterized protein EDB93DRAFT_1100715 [Suillus bovinus]|uniref:uncharacterized protein n=1 Tax=Suillus bovinus TaxID=48563 RepID=UPI001B87AC68|nr:uncharacterized protein EDB93DRAFT_1100715 [Suillus bovinus]KAG2157901.1 hypothetical protein EDB93DRAFT_1100715 [Suillus bovinus]
MGRMAKCLRVLSDSSMLSLSDYDSGITTPLVEQPQVDSPLGPQHTRCPNAGKGGAASQLRRVGEAVINVPERRTCKGQQFVIPDGELENIMAPSPAKRELTRKVKKAVSCTSIMTPDQSDDASSAPSLHIVEPGERFRLQKNPIPLGYIGLQPLGLEEHPEHLKSHIQQDRPRSHTRMEVAKRPAVELSVMHAPAIHGAQPIILYPKLSNPPVQKKLLGAGRAFPDSASSILQPVSVLENEETEHHGDKDMSKVDYGLNMVNDDKFPPSNDEMHTFLPVKFSLDRSADEDEDISHTQRHQGQVEQWVDHLRHASKDDRQNRRKDRSEWNQPQASRLHGTSKPACSNAIVEVHKKTNHHAQSPSPTYLHSVCHSGFMVNQANTKHARTSNLQSNNNHQAAGDSDGDMKVDTDLEVQHTSVGHHTKAAKNTQGGAVVAKWKTLGCILPLQTLFPACKEALSDTGICLELVTESIVAWEAQNCHLEADPQYEYDMATVIYNDSINFRSRIKQIAINIVPVEYKLSGSESEIKQKASALLKGSTYLCEEHDEHVCNVLHVYSMYGHVNTKQTALGDSAKVYRKLTNMLKQVADKEYHSEKLNEALQSWAMAGMTGVIVDDKPQDIKSDSDWVVELD